MVGAGFSQNADRARPSVADLPSWREITKQICRRLYPSEDGARLQNAIEEASATSGFLKLAQEFRAVFGRSALHQLIKNLVRDQDFKPGELHKRLLSLPWRDVFSTNWDTLLECARLSVTDRPYSVLRTAADVASSVQPRIVKLHGSFPSHYPFIVTEEDYRTYPRRFAPFVNTVQQAMMETVFLLIGFSGDDPNFLHWSGWVRDNMGSAAPMIYLAGWLDLSAHRRQLLVERHVVPIDLTNHPQALTWPEHLRHRHSIDWILRTLELGSPYDISDWPIPSHRERASVRNILEPVEVPVFDEPEEEPRIASPVAGTSTDEVRDVISVWFRNRGLYPGWLVLPSSVYELVSWRTDDWEPLVLRALPSLDSPIERLNAIRELLWRREILLEPVSIALEESASGVLDAIDCQARAVAGIKGDPGVDWSKVREGWRIVAIALVTAARFRFDRACFERRIDALAPYIDDHADVYQRICHERVLWALWELDFRAALDLVEDWREENSDPVWMMRKAAVLVEVHRPKEARDLVTRALADIRRSQDDGRSLSGRSREGWALFMAEAFERKIGERSRSRYDRRLTELAVFHCDGREELRRLTERVSVPTERSEGPDFDHGVEKHQIVFSQGEGRRLTAARCAVRLTEVAALPPIANRVKIARDILAAAADELVSSDPRMASQLILRICHYDNDPLLKRVLSRTRVAAMYSEFVEAVAQSCAHVIEFVVDNLSGETVERLRVAIEVLSRVVLRLSVDRVERTLDDALALYCNEVLARHLWLTAPIGNLLQRCWMSLPVQRRTERVLDVLLSPVVGSDYFIPDAPRHSLIDPGQLLSNDLPAPPRTAENETRWTSLVSLLIQGLRSGGETRRRAAIRICYSGLSERLTGPERLRIADALWHTDFTLPDALPSDTDLDDWEFLFLFEPTSKLADARFRAKWIRTADTDNIGRREQAENETTVVRLSESPAGVPSDLNSIFAQIGSAISGAHYRDQVFDLSEDEQRVLDSLIGRWCEVDIPLSVSGLDSLTARPIRAAVIGICTVLRDLKLSPDMADRLYTGVIKLHESGIPAYELIPGIVRALPDRLGDLLQLMRGGIVSDDVQLNRSAVGGTAEWMASARRLPDLHETPEDLVQEVGLTISTRRRSVLEIALRLATWIFTEGSQAHRDCIRGFVVHGLRYLVEALRYDRQQYDFDENDIPKLRWRCVQLAVAMEKQGLAEEQAVAAWMKVVADDPLPEVRYTRS